MKYRIVLIILALCLTTLTACASPVSNPAESAAPAPAAGAAPVQEESIPAAEAPVMDLTQESVIRKLTYEEKPQFERFLSVAEPVFTIPGLQQAMIPQGMCVRQSTGTVYISGYFSAARSSAVVAVDRESGTLKAQYELCTPDGEIFLSHVGGLAVNETDLYVSAKLDSDGQYQIARIPLSDLSDAGAQSARIAELITVPVSPSFLSYSRDILWIGNFYHPTADYVLPAGVEPVELDGEVCGCYILGYDMSKGRETVDFFAPDYILGAPDRIQGMLLCPDDTVLLSQSYGRKNDSAILRYALHLGDTADAQLRLGNETRDCYVLDGTRLTEAVTAMPMTEALALDTDGGVLLLFESGAMKYNDGKFRTDRVWKLNFSA